MTIDTVPLCNSPEDPRRRESRWWLPDDSAQRQEVTLHLPASVIELLAQVEQELGIAASDLVAYWVRGGASEALRSKERELGILIDHTRIVGWLPSGHAVTRD